MKTRVYSVRLSDDIVKMKPDKMDLSTFIRQAILNSKVIDKQDARDAITQLRHVGVNLNQITRTINADKNIDGAADVVKAVAEDIKQALNNIKNVFL